jgi:excisionase family DNA binding protein
MRAAARLFAVALEAGPVCDLVFSGRASDHERALVFLDRGIDVISRDLRKEGDRPADEVSTSEAARMLDVQSVNTVKAWIGRGLFRTAEQTAGGHWRISRDEVEAFARRREAAARWRRDGSIQPPRGSSETDL